MTNSKLIRTPSAASGLVKAMPHLPPPAISATAGIEGTKITIFFLAIENFANRYPTLPFVTQSLVVLKKRLKDLLTNDTAISNQVRQFILGMPLDTISSSAHPKRLKQIVLESLLNPETLTSELIQTDSLQKRTASAPDLVRDLQFYCKLNELCFNPHYGREILSAIGQGILLLKSEERLELKLVIDKLNFYHPTDRAYILKHTNGISIISLRPEQIVAPETKAIMPSRPQDYALTSILLFRRFKNNSQEIVARAGETLDSIQSRAHLQQREYQVFISECKQIPTEGRDKIHHHVAHQWKTFAGTNSRYGKDMNNFLNLLANPG